VCVLRHNLGEEQWVPNLPVHDEDQLSSKPHLTSGSFVSNPILLRIAVSLSCARLTKASIRAGTMKGSLHSCRASSMMRSALTRSRCSFRSADSTARLALASVCSFSCNSDTLYSRSNILEASVAATSDTAVAEDESVAVVTGDSSVSDMAVFSGLLHFDCDSVWTSRDSVRRLLTSKRSNDTRAWERRTGLRLRLPNRRSRSPRSLLDSCSEVEEALRYLPDGDRSAVRDRTVGSGISEACCLLLSIMDERRPLSETDSILDRPVVGRPDGVSIDCGLENISVVVLQPSIQIVRMNRLTAHSIVSRLCTCFWPL